MVLASNLFLLSVIFESDNLCLIEAGRGNMVREEIRNIITDIISLKSQFQQCGFTWTTREGNGVAHCIASMADNGDFPRNWMSNPPPMIRKAMVFDLQNIRPCV